MYEALSIETREFPSWPRQASRLKWIAAIGFAAVDAIWSNIEGYHFTGISVPLISGSIILIIGWALLFGRLHVGAFVFADALSFIILFPAAASVLSYLMVHASRGFPLVDSSLSSVDNAIGFDWPSYFIWIKAHPSLDRILNLAYVCWGPQWIVLPTLLAYREDSRIRELLSLGVIGLIIMMPFMAFFPALSAGPYYFPDNVTNWVQHITALRDGTTHTLDLMNMPGLVSFPSFHTVGALFFIYVCRNIKLLFPLSVALNVTIIISTLSAGSHYLADMISGAIVAALTIAFYRLGRNQCTT